MNKTGDKYKYNTLIVFCCFFSGGIIFSYHRMLNHAVLNIEKYFKYKILLVSKYKKLEFFLSNS